MRINKVYRVELKLNNKERSLFSQCAGTARFTYNWGLARKIESFEALGKSPSAVALHKELNLLKKSDFSWMYDLSKCIPQQALRDLDVAYKNFFDRVKKGKEQAGFPKFKSKHRATPSFYLEGAIKVDNDQIKLPRIGWVRLKEYRYIPTSGVRILSVRVTSKANRWFISVNVEETIPDYSPTKPAIGIDLGINRLATTSERVGYPNGRHLKRSQKQLARLQRKLARQIKGSARRQITKNKIATLHFKIGNQRKDAIHKATSDILAKTKPEYSPVAICVEDLNVAGMMKNGRLSKALADASMGEFARQLNYKSAWLGIEMVKADRFYPSSQLCSQCGERQKMSLSERTYNCPSCQFKEDRDINAALNLLALY